MTQDMLNLDTGHAPTKQKAEITGPLDSVERSSLQQPSSHLYITSLHLSPLIAPQPKIPTKI
jgi:hypothetical protein